MKTQRIELWFCTGYLQLFLRLSESKLSVAINGDTNRVRNKINEVKPALMASNVFCEKPLTQLMMRRMAANDKWLGVQTFSQFGVQCCENYPNSRKVQRKQR